MASPFRHPPARVSVGRRRFEQNRNVAEIMPRYKLLIEYDGTGFAGWQFQDNGPSVQAALEAAVAAFSGEQVRVHGAGRTDAGVHARGQVAHLDLGRDWPAATVRDAINAHLVPQRISVLDAAAVGVDFDARFSAVGRHYRYRILDRRAPPAIDRDRVWHAPKGLDAERMAAAATVLVGHHDFTTFRAMACQAKSPWKTLERLEVTRIAEEIVVDAGARSFLHAQVRSMVGSLALVGDGRWTADDLAAALAARDRTACGPVAPAHGLTLMAVVYRDEDR
jgi:tRNA pseudouridine38-40 synthase